MDRELQYKKEIDKLTAERDELLKFLIINIKAEYIFNSDKNIYFLKAHNKNKVDLIEKITGKPIKEVLR